MSTSTFAYQHTRTKVAGAAESAPTTTSGTLVWQSKARQDVNLGDIDGMMFEATGANLAYEIGVWDKAEATPAYRVIETGTLTDGVPYTIYWPYGGEYFYIRSTGVTVADIKINAAPVAYGATASAALGTKLDTLHTDLDTTIHTDLTTTLGGKLDTLHTDCGTTIHNDLNTTVSGKLDTLHTDCGTTLHNDLNTTLAGKLDTLHTDCGTTLHNDLNTTIHTDLATTLAGKLDDLIADLEAYDSAAVITPHDSNTFTATRGVLVGGAGNIVAQFAGDAGLTTIAVLAGHVYPISVIKVTTATTATNLVALY